VEDVPAYGLDEYRIDPLNEFNDAKKTVRLSQGKFRMPQRLA